MGSYKFRVAGLVGIVLFSALIHYSYAALIDTSIDWDLFNSPSGFTIPYTFNGQPVSDEESASDSSTGGAAPNPSSIDLASGSPDGSNPGPYDTPSYGYYNGGTDYDVDDPSTMEDDYVLFVMRLVGDPSKGDGFASYHWNVLFDVDGDGYKEFWIDIDGGTTANGPDELKILYDNSNTQLVADEATAEVEVFNAYNNDTSISFTRVRAAGDGTGDYFIDIQVPMTAFNDLNGNQVLYPDSPVGFVFSTGASNQNPLQKDFMTDLDFLSTSDPISFGDVVKSNGDPTLYFSDSNLEQVEFYNYSGDNVYLYLKDPFANLSSGSVETVTATVTNAVTGDDETVTLTESGPDTGIFSNLGGASAPVSSDAANGWIPYVTTSVISNTEDWTAIFDSGSGFWNLSGAISGSQTAMATTGTEYTSDSSSITFTLYEDSPANGDTVTFTTYAGDPLLTSKTSGTDDDGYLYVFSGNTITYSYTTAKSKTFTDTASIIGGGEPFIQFTDVQKNSVSSYDITSDTATSDKLYVTVYHAFSNTSSTVAQTITVSLSGRDSETITLTETGVDTGIFINDGLSTQIDDGAPTGSVWEDIDGGVVTATFTYSGTDYTITATFFATADAGQVSFMNGAGTVDVDLYSAQDPVWVKVEDQSVCFGNMSAIVTSTTGDSETIYMFETYSGSNQYMNKYTDLVTTASSAVVTSTTSTFQSDGVTAGDIFAIADGPDAGTFTVYSTISQTEIMLTENLTSDRTDVGFNATPLMTATYDDAYAANDGVLEVADGDTITVRYTDCTDGDADASNNDKTDTASYNAPSIVINEVLFNTGFGTYTGNPYEDYEVIQLYNASSTFVNISSYQVKDEDGFSYTIPSYGGSGIQLGAGEKVNIVLVYQPGPNITSYNDYDSVNGIYYLYATASSPDVLGDPADKTDLVTTASSAVVTSASSTFIADGLQAGDPFVIATGSDAGTYTVSSVDSETQVTLTAALTASATDVSFNSGDAADQVSLYNAAGTIEDLVAWSTTPDNTTDFKSDDGPAVSQGIWTDNSYLDVDGNGMIAQGSSIRRITDGVDSDVPEDWTYGTMTIDMDFIITVAVVSSFDVYEEGGRAVVEWKTASEVGTVGFNLYRRDGATGEYVKLNSNLLTGLLHSQQGGVYSYVGDGVFGGETHSYKLEEMESKGGARLYGPFEVTVGERGGSSQDETASFEGKAHEVSSEKLGRIEKANKSRRLARSSKKMSRYLSVYERGIYYMSSGEIAALLEMPEEDVFRLIERGGIALYHRGSEVAYHAGDAGGNLFFFGEGPDISLDEVSTYKLIKSKGLKMGTTGGSAADTGVTEYSRKGAVEYRASDDRLLLKADANSAVTVSGFSGPDIILLDIKDPKRPNIVNAAISKVKDDDYSIDFSAINDGSVYYVTTVESFMSPVYDLEDASSRQAQEFGYGRGASNDDEAGKENSQNGRIIAFYNSYSKGEEAADDEVTPNGSSQEEGPVEDNSAAAAGKENKLSHEKGKIFILEEGIYYLDAEEIAAMLSISVKDAGIMINSNQISISNMGEDVAYHPDKKGSGIYFFGEVLDSTYSSENVYWLKNAKGLVAGEVQSGRNGSGRDNTFLRTSRAEENVYAASAIFSDPGADFWMWDYVMGGIPGIDKKTFTIPSNSVDRDSDEAVLTVRLFGGTDTGANPDHHIQVSINGEELGDSYWDGTEPLDFNVSFDAELLNDGENSVEVAGIADTRAPYSLVYVDSIELSYQSFYRAYDDKLLFESGSNGVLTVSGFSEPDVIVFDISDPKRPVLVNAVAYEGEDGTYEADINALDGSTYYAAATKKVLSASDYWQDIPSSLASEENSADYLVIAPSELKDSVQGLADYRSSHGLDAMVVDLEDIMDEFNYGIYSPDAVKDFLAHAYRNWGKRPKYVVLAGAGSMDYKNYLGLNDNFMPPMMVSTPDGLVANDNAFADVEGDDGIPEMAVGRLPFVSADEVNAYLNKVIAFEGSGDTWKSRVLMLADDDKNGGNFSKDSDKVASLIPSGYEVEKVYLSEYPLDEAEQMVVDEINSGVMLVNYVGHGGLDRFSAGGLLDTGDLGKLKNSDKPFIVTALSCMVGRFDFPGFDSLSESLLLKSDGGAVAAWTSSGMSSDSEAKKLGIGFYSTIFADDEQTLGLAVIEAMEQYGRIGLHPHMLSIYNIFGDPALKIR